MYGEIFIEKIEKFCMVLLFIIFNIFKKGKLFKLDNFFVFILGIVMCVFR